MLRPLAALVALSCTACPFQVLHSVAEMKGKAELSIELEFGEDTLRSFSPPDGGTLSQLTLGEWSHGTGSDLCPALGPDAVATLNGKPITNVDRGSAVGNICHTPTWSFDSSFTVEPTMEIKIKDGSGELVATFVNVLGARTVAVSGVDGGAIPAGGPVAITFSPATDVIPDPSDPNHYGSLQVGFQNVDGSTHFAPYPGASIVGNVATVSTIPAGSNALFAGEIGSAGTTRCDVGHCELPFAFNTPPVPLTFGP